MSPEQAAGQLDKLGPASDIYSPGATLYALLAGWTTNGVFRGIFCCTRRHGAG